MKRFMAAMITMFVLVVSATLAEAININRAEVQNGVAVVRGGRAASRATITWDGVAVTAAGGLGRFSFTGAVPADCVGTLSDGVTTLDVILANCTATASTGGGVLATGQITCYDSNGAVISCLSTGQDGELKKGAARSYTDNGNGTVTDNVTGLMWEKLTNDGTIHDVNNSYTWDVAFGKIQTLNSANFAGHNDWRLPNVNELQTLINYGTAFPAIDPAFNNGDRKSVV